MSDGGDEHAGAPQLRSNRKADLGVALGFEPQRHEQAHGLAVAVQQRVTGGPAVRYAASG